MIDADLRSALDLKRAERREQAGYVSLMLEYVLQRVEHRIGALTRQHERSPGGAQADADRGFVGAVAADVAHHHVEAVLAASARGR